MNERFIITGGCGFVGVNLIRQLRPIAGHIRVLDNLSLGKKEDLAGLDVELIIGDIRDVNIVKKAVREMDVLVHLAAHTRVIDSIEQPRENFEVNVTGTFNLLEAARQYSLKRFVFASTGGAIIGEAEPPVHEEMLAKPISPYGASKLMGEAYCSAFAGAYGLPCIALRFSNVYGPFSYHKGSVVAKFFKNLINGQPLTVYGDGTQTRDFVFVHDLCKAIEVACNSDLQGFQVFNIASGVETSILELLEETKNVVGGDSFEVHFVPPRQGEVYRNFALIEKARRILGYKPTIALSEGLSLTWDWFLSKKTEI